VRKWLVAAAVASAVANRPAWGHTFPPLRTVVVQVERCEVALLVGYTPRTDAAEAIMTRSVTQPKPQRLDALRALLAEDALAALSITVDGVPLQPTGVQSKIGAAPGGARPAAVILVTYALRGAGRLAVASREPATTRISWTDRSAGRVTISSAPAQRRWFDGVASFLLQLGPGGPPCER
jgi:hypothetical protein